jgi:hypothetical protein
MSGGRDSAPFAVTLGEPMVAEGLAGWGELEQFALRPEGAVQR